jgi:GntR family transcriptional regulator
MTHRAMRYSNDAASPLHDQVRRDLYERVRSGEFRPGAILPNESKLCDEYGVSRITIRRAIGDLCAENVLFRRHGVGTFVADPVAALQSVQLRGHLNDVLAYDRRVRFKFLERTEKTNHKPPEVSAAFGPDRATSVIHSLVEVDGEIFSAVQFHLAAEDAGLLRPTDFSTHTQPIVRISERLGRPLWRANQITVAAAADSRIAGLLRVADGSPVMAVLRTYFDADDEPLAVVIAHCHPARYRLEIAFQSPSAGLRRNTIRRRVPSRRDGGA